ncbi:ubiquitin-like protein [Ceratobasidium sp. AG-Ba]|nr:ubiquitin-like protein [Ceratobasidium sp. AG-Ba]
MESSSKNNLLFIIADCNGEKVTVPRKPSYEDTIKYVKSTFIQLSSTPAEDIGIYARFEHYEDLIRVTEDLWSELMPDLTMISVLVNSPSTDAYKRSVESRLTTDVNRGLRIASVRPENKQTGWNQERDNKFEITVTYMSTPFSSRRVLVSPKTKFRKILNWVSKDQGGCPDSLRVFYFGERVLLSDTLGDRGVQENDEIDIYAEQKGKKPIIYIYPPVPTRNIRLDLSLVKQWDFSALYPPTLIKAHDTQTLGHTVSWVVSAKPDGTLLDHATQREVAYLFWEAQTNPIAPISPACSRPLTPDTDRQATIFDPSRPELFPHNAVLMSFDKVTGYIDDALISLGLHVEARTSFITQEAYAAAAPMKIDPAPNVITRVFMLFKGIEESQLGYWAPAQARATENPNIWATIVGVNLEMARDKRLFRVLEWGGMEIN